MKFGMNGLGRMDENMSRLLMRGGQGCVVFDRSEKAVAELAGDGAEAAHSPEELVGKLEPPRAVWVMLPAGEPTEQTIEQLGGGMKPGDTIIDGGNSYYKDDVRRSGALAARGIRLLDAGTSGGVWGAERGY